MIAAPKGAIHLVQTGPGQTAPQHGDASNHQSPRNRKRAYGCFLPCPRPFQIQSQRATRWRNFADAMVVPHLLSFPAIVQLPPTMMR